MRAPRTENAPRNGAGGNAVTATGFLYDPLFLEHDTGAGHPERRQRLTTTLKELQGRSWFARLRKLAARRSEEEWVRAVHAPDYVRRAEHACRNGAPFLDVPDVRICKNSYEVALRAAGATLELADRLTDGTIDNGFALLRPPGHHAETALAMGFCLFNNAAILVRYLQGRHGLDKIAVLDWDVHHGNGTQHCFEQDPSVLYISLHQYPFYPGTGAAHETGDGRGRGATVNCPMAAGSGDAEYRQAFRERVLPALNAFRPEAIVLSAGFDAHRDDPLANIELSTECYGWMSRRILEVAERHCAGRVLSLLEGGYHPRALPACVASHLAEMCGNGGPETAGAEDAPEIPPRTSPPTNLA